MNVVVFNTFNMHDLSYIPHRTMCDEPLFIQVDDESLLILQLKTDDILKVYNSVEEYEAKVEWLDERKARGEHESDYMFLYRALKGIGRPYIPAVQVFKI